MTMMKLQDYRLEFDDRMFDTIEHGQVVVNGTSPNAEVTIGKYDPAVKRVRQIDRLTGAEVKEHGDGKVITIVGTSRMLSEDRQLPVSDRRLGLKATPNKRGCRDCG